MRTNLRLPRTLHSLPPPHAQGVVFGWLLSGHAPAPGLGTPPPSHHPEEQQRTLTHHFHGNPQQQWADWL